MNITIHTACSSTNKCIVKKLARIERGMVGKSSSLSDVELEAALTTGGLIGTTDGKSELAPIAFLGADSTTTVLSNLYIRTLVVTIYIKS